MSRHRYRMHCYEDAAWPERQWLPTPLDHAFLFLPVVSFTALAVVLVAVSRNEAPAGPGVELSLLAVVGVVWLMSGLAWVEMRAWHAHPAILVQAVAEAVLDVATVQCADGDRVRPVPERYWLGLDHATAMRHADEARAAEVPASREGSYGGREQQLLVALASPPGSTWSWWGHDDPAGVPSRVH